MIYIGVVLIIIADKNQSVISYEFVHNFVSFF